jgi:aryl-alcohol dehydrogenase
VRNYPTVWILVNVAYNSPSNSIAIFGVGGVGLSSIITAKIFECSTIIAVDIED